MIRTDGSNLVRTHMITPLRRLLLKRSIPVCRAEIHIDRPDEIALEAEDFCVAKTLAVLGHATIGHESHIAIDGDTLKIMLRDPVGNTPAAGEIGPLVDPVVERARKGEIIRERVFDGLAVIAQIGCKQVSIIPALSALTMLTPAETCARTAPPPSPPVRMTDAPAAGPDRPRRCDARLRTDAPCSRNRAPAQLHSRRA